MTIVTTQLGPMTKKLSIKAETSSANVLTALSSAIVAGGWAQYDSYNGENNRVYRSLCKDGTTYKYVLLKMDPGSFRIGLSVFESWNATTHVGTNEDYYRSLGHSGFCLDLSDILVMVGPRWLILQTFTRGQPSPWYGCIELHREFAEDTASSNTAPFVFFHSSSVHNPSFPKVRSGLTSQGSSGLQTDQLKLTSTVTTDQLAQYNPWDTSKKVVHSLRPMVGTSDLYGACYGLKVASNVGAPYQTLSLPVDSEFDYAINGTATDHWVLGESVQKLATVFSPGPNSQYAELTVSTSVTPSIPYSMVCTGNFYYVGHGTGVSKFDAGPGLNLMTPLVSGITSATGPFYDLAFDGRYVYASTTTGVLRIDTQNSDAVTTVTTPNGSSSLFWDGTWLFAGARGSRVNNVVYKIDPATFTTAATFVVSASATTPCGLCTDYAGNLYVSSLEVGTLIYKIVIATGVSTSFKANPQTAAVATSSSLYWDGSNIYVGFVQASGLAYLSGYTLAGSNFFNSSTSITLNSAYPVKMTLAKIGGYWLLGAGATSMGAPGMSIHPGVRFSGSAAVVQTVTGTTGINLIVSDGCRMYGIKYNGQLVSFNRMNRADDQGTQRGRFLLPK